LLLLKRRCNIEFNIFSEGRLTKTKKDLFLLLAFISFVSLVEIKFFSLVRAEEQCPYLLFNFFDTGCCFSWRRPLRRNPFICRICIEQKSKQKIISTPFACQHPILQE